MRVPKYTLDKKKTVLEKGQKSTMFTESTGQARIEEGNLLCIFLLLLLLIRRRAASQQ